MSIDWASFTPASAAMGGALIGLAAGMLLLLNGRVAGISGIAGNMLRPVRGDIGWRIAFLAGLVAAPACYALVGLPSALRAAGLILPWERPFGLMRTLPAITFDIALPAIALAGFLVGIGTRYGAGCTSGHGICGISRLSPRSIVATCCFIAAGIASTFVVRHLLVVAS